MDLDLTTSKPDYYIPRPGERVSIMVDAEVVKGMKNNYGWTGPVELAFEDSQVMGTVMWVRNAI